MSFLVFMSWDMVLAAAADLDRNGSTKGAANTAAPPTTTVATRPATFASRLDGSL